MSGATTSTPDGYLWIGTKGGLLRFDGARFVVFDHTNAPGLSESSCCSLPAGLPSFDPSHPQDYPVFVVAHRAWMAHSIIGAVVVFIGGCIFGHWVTNSDPAFLKILGRSEKFKLRYDAAKQTVPNVEVR